MQIVNPHVKLDVIQVVMSLAEVAVKVAALTLALAVVRLIQITSLTFS